MDSSDDGEDRQPSEATSGSSSWRPNGTQKTSKTRKPMNAATAAASGSATTSKKSTDRANMRSSNDVEMTNGNGLGAAQQLLRQYFNQITVGCGQKSCSNPFCRSSGGISSITDPNEAGAMAMLYLTNHRPLCSLVAQNTNCLSSTGDSAIDDGDVDTAMDSDVGDMQRATVSKKDCIPEEMKVPLSMEKITSMIEQCQTADDWTSMRWWLGFVFSNCDMMACSFVDDAGLLDLEKIRSAMLLLFGEHVDNYGPALIRGLEALCENLEFEFRYHNAYNHKRQYMNILRLLMELPFLKAVGMEFFSDVLPGLCKVYTLVPREGIAELVKNWSQQSKEWMLEKIHSIQQALTVRIYHKGYDRAEHHSSQRLAEDETIVLEVKLLDMLYRASLNAGRRANFEQPVDDSSTAECDRVLNITTWDIRDPLIAAEEFRNEAVSESFSCKEDFVYYKNDEEGDEQSRPFSFLPNYAFLILPSAKLNFLFYDSRIQMNKERRRAQMEALTTGTMVDPFLRLVVSRDHLVRDAIDWLYFFSGRHPEEFRKQLRVEFNDEDGVDEGGVSKEFYQLITDQLFNLDYGMFTYNEQTRLFWFNPSCCDMKTEYRLIGILFGLAIYNGILIEVHFPLVLYRKLFGQIGEFEDLQQLDPVTYSSLCDLLAYEGGDYDTSVEAVFGMTFRVSYCDVYGHHVTHDLVPNGDTVPVTKDNRTKFANLYADFLLNKSIWEQFDSFRQGFRQVVDDSLLMKLCTPDEMEQILCGIQDLDFTTLEKETHCHNGYDRESPTIKLFWSVVHEMTDEEKKLLLQFCTGCDRVPIGGLKTIDFSIAKNGDDDKRLPTAHTCYNVLLLPEYRTKEVMRERLMKAIKNCRGFGLR